MDIVSLVTALMSAKWFKYVTGGLSTIAGLGWLALALKSDGHLTAAHDVAFAVMAAGSLLHFFQSSASTDVNLAHVARMPDGLVKLRALIARTRPDNQEKPTP